jgi:class 3 adenylate cyclase/tetratricopeptide (TPR) repeat protein
MTFEEILDQAIAMLQRRGRLTYSTLKRQFQLDDAALDDVKNELIEGQRLAVDERGNVLVWTGDTASGAASAAAPVLAQAPLTYTPAYLAEKILTSRRALAGERKQVTVLFADLKGSTELIRDLDSEAAQQLLDPALYSMMDAVHRYEGTVNQVLGDGIMALFGAPVAHEDHAARACYAALAMQTALRRYAEEVRRSHGLEMQARVGLNSGEVVVRAIGNDLHMDYSAVGPTTHLAARMEQLATPGSIRLTAATLRLAEGLLQVHALGLVPVRGLTEPVEVFELVGASAIRGRLQASAARGLTRFVGRQQELTAMQQALERAGTGHGQVVALVGEPGVGKSRAVYEFVHSHHTSGWLVLESASVSYGKATPYFPVIDLLRRYCHSGDHDDTRTIRAKLTGQVLTLDPAFQDTLPALLSLLDALPEDSPFLTLDPPQRRQRTLDALKRVFLRESQEQALLLVFEDLHWIDAETQALLQSLVESLPSARLLLLVNYRPEYQHGWGSKTYYTQLQLDPLPVVSADEFLHVLLGDDASLTPLTQLLIARTEGNPFFLEESVRTLIETGVLVGERGAYRLGQPQALPTIPVPATVQAMLAARIDRLSPEEKRLLQTAAVIGTEVPMLLLQAIAELPMEALHRSLACLQAAEFLYETRLFPEQEYTFTHALTHEVAYGSLLQERRQGLHARIVEALEACVGDWAAAGAAGHSADQVARLAHHALRGALWNKAVTYCQQAGTKARARAAFRESVVYREQALQSLAHLPESDDTRRLALDLRLAMLPSLAALGEYGRQLALVGEAETLARALDDRARLVWVLSWMTTVRRLMGDHEGAMTAGQQALTLATELGERALQIEASHHLGAACYFFGDFGQAAKLQRWVVEGADRDRESGTSSTGVQSIDQTRITDRAWLARTLSALGAFAEGRYHGKEALRRAILAGRGDVPIFAHACLGDLYLAQGDLEHAIRVFDQGLALCQASGERRMWRGLAAGLSSAYTLQGRLMAGRALLEEAISESLRSGGLLGHASHLTRLSEICRRAGHGEEAGQHARQAHDLARQQKARGEEALALHQLGVVHVHTNPSVVVQAEPYYQQALALAKALGMRPLQAHCHCGLGTLYAAIGQQEQARAALSTAIAMYRAMDMAFWLPQAEAALAQVAQP